MNKVTRDLKIVLELDEKMAKFLACLINGVNWDGEIGKDLDLLYAGIYNSVTGDIPLPGALFVRHTQKKIIHDAAWEIIVG